jgi:hypothetical protein
MAAFQIRLAGSSSDQPVTSSHPLTTTFSSRYALSVIGLSAVPLRGNVTVSRYVPPRISKVSPGWSLFTAACNVASGCVSVPG